MCSRINCRFVHLMEHDKVEVCDQRVAVCRDHANGLCKRKLCKYYHIPIILPPANIMATVFKAQNSLLSSTLTTSNTPITTTASISTITSNQPTINEITNIQDNSNITPILLPTANAKINSNYNLNSTISSTNNLNNNTIDMSSTVHIIKPAMIRKSSTTTNTNPTNNNNNNNNNNTNLSIVSNFISPSIKNQQQQQQQQQQIKASQHHLNSITTANAVTAITTTTTSIPHNPLISSVNHFVDSYSNITNNNNNNNNNNPIISPKISHINFLNNNGILQPFYWQSFNNNYNINNILPTDINLFDDTKNVQQKNFQQLSSTTLNNNNNNNAHYYNQNSNITTATNHQPIISITNDFNENLCSGNFFNENLLSQQQNIATTNFPSNIGIYSHHVPIHNNNIGLTNVLITSSPPTGGTPVTVSSTVTSTSTITNLPIHQNFVENKIRKNNNNNNNNNNSSNKNNVATTTTATTTATTLGNCK